jgi:hypothetical protein
LSTIAPSSIRTELALSKKRPISLVKSLGDICSASVVDPRTSANSKEHSISAPPWLPVVEAVEEVGRAAAFRRLAAEHLGPKGISVLTSRRRASRRYG